jgi:aspartate carbamoyltransferase catalytic subunit
MNLTTIAGLTDEEIDNLLLLAGQITDTPLKGKTVILCFFEPSTRTRVSFELAANQLGADVVLVDQNSSHQKGETLIDTVKTLTYFEPSAIVLRSPYAGLIEVCKVDTPLINAGDGMHAHPTQALADLYTLEKELGEIKDKQIAFVGDCLHSRVMRSSLELFRRRGAKISLIGPPQLVPPILESLDCRVSHRIEDTDGADVIYCLRPQLERMRFEFDSKSYRDNYQLQPEHIEGKLLMHPGPQGDIEISADVGESPLIAKQVKNGLLVRKAALASFRTN